MNNIHPFGLPLWKPALYKKSRSIVRNANSALHSSPPTRPELYLYPGNILWTLVFGWWLALVYLVVALLLYITPLGGAQYGRVLRELAGYLWWPFGRYVERRVLIVDGEYGVEEGEDDEVDAGEETALLTPRKERRKKRKNWPTIQEVWSLGLGGWVFYFWLYLLIGKCIIVLWFMFSQIRTFLFRFDFNTSLLFSSSTPVSRYCPLLVLRHHHPDG